VRGCLGGRPEPEGNVNVNGKALVIKICLDTAGPGREKVGISRARGINQSATEKKNLRSVIRERGGGGYHPKIVHSGGERGGGLMLLPETKR